MKKVFLPGVAVGDGEGEQSHKRGEQDGQGPEDPRRDPGRIRTFANDITMISEIASLCNLAKYPLGGTSALAVICTLVDAMK